MGFGTIAAARNIAQRRIKRRSHEPTHPGSW
jgi:hypothetical protein